MKKVFVGGSRKMGRLNSDIRQRLDGIMAQSFTLLVGDANGVDKAVQRYCSNTHYKHVIVFCAGHACRNNIGGWEARHIEVDRSAKDYKFYMAKDIEMAKEADYGFMIWDAESSGTLSNILELLERGKKVLVYIGPHKRFVKLHGIEDLQQVLNTCTQDAIEVYDSKFNLSRRIQSNTPHQLQMFS